MTAAVSPIPGANGPRMCCALVDLGGDILRDALYYHIHPGVIVPCVLGTSYFRRHPLNPHQMSILKNASIKGDYSECDVTLLYTLLRNLPQTSTALRPTAGWGKLPVTATNITLGDDIERIRGKRNEVYGHVPTTDNANNVSERLSPLADIPNHIYSRYMSEFQAVCFRMDHTHAGSLKSATPRIIPFTQTLNHIQVSCMDPDSEARYTDEIRRMEEADRETRDLLSDHQNAKVEVHELRLENHERRLLYKTTISEHNIDSLTQQAEQQNLKLEQHNEQIEHQPHMAEAHSAQLDTQSRAFERHSEQILYQRLVSEDHSAQLNTHSQALERQSEQILYQRLVTEDHSA